jgi:hypothetical protein
MITWQLLRDLGDSRQSRQKQTNGKPTTREEIETCWNDQHNRMWGFYYCKADPRVIVPSRWKWMGWTVNFARPSAIPVLLGLVALVGLPLVIVSASGSGTIASLITGVVSIAVVCLLSAYLSSSKRWSH